MRVYGESMSSINGRWNMNQNKKQLSWRTTALVVLVFVALGAPAQAIPVDTELQLLVDISGSVDATEYNLQLQGYVDAFRNPVVQSSIANGTHGQIAVQFIYWSGNNQQQVMADWTLIDSSSSANAFANTLDALSRPFSGMTYVGDAMQFGLTQFQGDNGFEGTSQVMDVSGDGTQNGGSSTSAARDDALAVIDTINGLPIGSSLSLATWYNDNVIGGTDAFLLPALSFADFQAAIEQKLLQEIGPPPVVPEPITLASLGICVLGIGRYLKRRTEA